MKIYRYIIKLSPMENTIIAAFTLISAIIPTILLVYTADFIDIAVTLVKSGGQSAPLITTLLKILLMMVVQFLISEAIKWTHLIKEKRVNQKVQLERLDKKEKLPYETIENEAFWKEMALIEKEPEMRIMRFFDQSLSGVALVVRILGFTMVLTRYLWWIGLLVVAVSALMILFSKRLGQFDDEAFEEAETHYHRASYFENVLSSKEASEERTLFGFHEVVNAHWNHWFSKGVHANNQALKSLMIRMSATHLVSKSIAVVIGLMLLLPLKWGLLTAGLYMSLLGNGFQLVDYMTRDMVQILKTLSSDKRFLARYLNYLSLAEENRGKGQAIKSDRQDLVVFKNVSFKYPGTTNEVIKNLTFVFERGKKYALVGENGAGKSTLAKLMMGLYTSYEGEIFLGGTELKDCSKEALSAFYSAAFQDFFPYEIALEDFLRLGAEPSSLNESAMWQCLQQLGMRESIEALPMGLKTPLGKLSDGSITLSGGQLQKLVIGRTLLRDASFTLLDEPTAAIDPIQERALYKLFMALETGKTSLIITHRLGAAVVADEILVLKNGHFVECGTHEALIHHGGYYSKMYDAQKGWYNG